MTKLDKWFEAIPQGRNDKCPCGCGKKMKKIIVDPNTFKEHEENFYKNLVDK